MSDVHSRLQLTPIKAHSLFAGLDLEWQIVYVGSASSEAHDQTLDSVLVGPVPAGRHRFVFQVRIGCTNICKLLPATRVKARGKARARVRLGVA